ncbi:MAG: hypothetical protein V4736_11755 [Bdellovibrionota bacterium]
MHLLGSFLTQGKSYKGDFEFDSHHKMMLSTDMVFGKGQKLVVNLSLPELGMICVTMEVTAVEKKEGRVVHSLYLAHSDFLNRRKLKKCFLSMKTA